MMKNGIYAFAAALALILLPAWTNFKKDPAEFKMGVYVSTLSDEWRLTFRYHRPCTQINKYNAGERDDKISKLKGNWDVSNDTVTVYFYYLLHGNQIPMDKFFIIHGDTLIDVEGQPNECPTCEGWGTFVLKHRK